MYKRKATVVNPTGLHARPASDFTNAAKLFDSSITLVNLSVDEDNRANAKSIINVLAIAASRGSEVEISAEGPDEKQAVDTLIEMVESGFGE